MKHWWHSLQNMKHGLIVAKVPCKDPKEGGRDVFLQLFSSLIHYFFLQLFSSLASDPLISKPSPNSHTGAPPPTVAKVPPNAGRTQRKTRLLFPLSSILIVVEMADDGGGGGKWWGGEGWWRRSRAVARFVLVAKDLLMTTVEMNLYNNKIL